MPTNLQIDLERRTFLFAQRVRDYLRLQNNGSIEYYEYAKQLIRSNSSVAANYIEANEALSKKDFLNRLKICRKESKESMLWLKLMNVTKEQQELILEAHAFVKIFNAILYKNS